LDLNVLKGYHVKKSVDRIQYKKEQGI